jgi:hypothetical protein
LRKREIRHIPRTGTCRFFAGRTIILHGVVLLIVFAIYLFETAVP